ncbi:MAG: YraN family protein [Gemmiger sp.]|nr:YraN family protein [Gemmiger sp.]
MDKAETAALGQKGEAVAAKYYIRKGYLLLNHNYRTRLGELDLILYKADVLVFAEVKTRTDAGGLAPALAVDYYKQRRLIAAAQLYLQKSPYADTTIRFDVVEVWPGPTGWQVHCIKDAFTC